MKNAHSKLKTAQAVLMDSSPAQHPLPREVSQACNKERARSADDVEAGATDYGAMERAVRQGLCPPGTNPREWLVVNDEEALVRQPADMFGRGFAWKKSYYAQLQETSAERAELFHASFLA